MTPIIHLLEFLTPCFSTGASKDIPEIRPPSIRGQLHLWFRLLGYDFTLERKIFGGIGVTASNGVKQDEHASPLVIRVSEVNAEPPQSYATLPHHTGGRAAVKTALPPGTTFKLHFINRLTTFTHAEEAALRHSLDAWLLCGALGLRSGRGGGALQQIGDPFSDKSSWEEALSKLPTSRQFGAAILDQAYPKAEAARTIITNTIGGPDRGNHPVNLQQINHPLGMVNPGRKTSPLRLTVRRVGNGYRIIASWDRRTPVTGNTAADLNSAVAALSASGKPLGDLLQTALPRLTGH